MKWKLVSECKLLIIHHKKYFKMKRIINGRKYNSISLKATTIINSTNLDKIAINEAYKLTLDQV